MKQASGLEEDSPALACHDLIAAAVGLADDMDHFNDIRGWDSAGAAVYRLKVQYPVSDARLQELALPA